MSDAGGAAVRRPRQLSSSWRASFARTRGVRARRSRSCWASSPTAGRPPSCGSGPTPTTRLAVPAHGATLDALIAGRPRRGAGRRRSSAGSARGCRSCSSCWRPRTPLSIQVHPTLAQAQAGFAAEDAAGIPRDAAAAQLPRPQPQARTALRAHAVRRPVRLPAGGRHPAAAGRARRAPAGSDRRPAGRPGRAAGGVHRAAHHSRASAASWPRWPRRPGAIGPDSRWAGPASAVAHTVEEFPGDIGVVLSLLLNHVELRPGEAIYLGAGNVHAYLRGLGVEIMANSDNVLRCGLTPKHVDVPELLEDHRLHRAGRAALPDASDEGDGRRRVCDVRRRTSTCPSSIWRRSGPRLERG